jgi:hypothetical protein
MGRRTERKEGKPKFFDILATAGFWCTSTIPECRLQGNEKVFDTSQGICIELPVWLGRETGYSTHFLRKYGLA